MSAIKEEQKDAGMCNKWWGKKKEEEEKRDTISVIN